MKIYQQPNNHDSPQKTNVTVLASNLRGSRFENHIFYITYHKITVPLFTNFDYPWFSILLIFSTCLIWGLIIEILRKV